MLLSKNLLHFKNIGHTKAMNIENLNSISINLYLVCVFVFALNKLYTKIQRKTLERTHACMASNKGDQNELLSPDKYHPFKFFRINSKFSQKKDQNSKRQDQKMMKGFAVWQFEHFLLIIPHTLDITESAMVQKVKVLLLRIYHGMISDN